MGGNLGFHGGQGPGNCLQRFYCWEMVSLLEALTACCDTGRLSSALALGLICIQACKAQTNETHVYRIKQRYIYGNSEESDKSSAFNASQNNTASTPGLISLKYNFCCHCNFAEFLFATKDPNFRNYYEREYQ